MHGLEGSGVTKPKVEAARKRYEEAVRQMRKTADRVLDKQGMLPVRDVFEAEQEKINKQLRRALRGRLKQEVTPADLKRVDLWLAKRSVDLADNLGQAMTRNVRDALTESMRASSRFLHKVRLEASPVDEVHAQQKLVLGNLQTLKDIQVKNTARFTAQFVEGIRKSVMLQAPKQATVGDVVESVEVALESQWWRLERLVRTESSFAYNRLQADAIAMAGAELKGLMGRWTELVDDATGKPYDSAVAVDSVHLHAQVAGPGGLFLMPAGAPVPHRLQGKSWRHPPNRPNDRAVVTPWMRGWGVPAWMIQAGARVSL